MAWPITHVVEGVISVVHEFEDEADDIPVTALVARSNQVGLPDPAGVQDEVDRGVVIVDVGPLPYVFSGPVQLGALTS
jgi:hypothetical protein